MKKPLLRKIQFICLYAFDFEASVKFYRDVLGLEPEYPEENLKTSDFYAFKTGDAQLAIERNGVRKDGLKTKAENPFLLQFEAKSPENLEEINKELESRGIQFINRSAKREYGLVTNFLDPDGNKVDVLYFKI